MRPGPQGLRHPLESRVVSSPGLLRAREASREGPRAHVQEVRRFGPLARERSGAPEPDYLLPKNPRNCGMRQMRLTTSTNALRKHLPLHVLVALVLLGILILLAVGKIEGKDAVTALLSLVATVAGAVLAFRLNESREDAKEAKRRKGALTRALFVLIEQEAALQGLWDSHLRHWADRADRAFNLPALRPPDYSSLKQDVSELQFLFEDEMDSAAGNTALKVLREDRTFHQALSAINLRSDFHINTFQPEISKKALQGTSLSFEQAQSELGDLILGRLVNETNIVYELSSEALKSLPVAQSELHALAKRIYPGSSFVKSDRHAQSKTA